MHNEPGTAASHFWTAGDQRHPPFPDRLAHVLLGRTGTERALIGRKTRLGHIIRQGSPALRAGRSAQRITTASGPVREKFERIAKRRGREIAKVAVAREILTLAYCGLPYHYQ